MHRALVVTDKPAWPPVSGADLRSCQIASALAELGSVTLASVLPLGSQAAMPAATISVVELTEQGEPRRDAFRRRRSYIEGRIPQVAVARLLRLAQELKPDAIVVEGIPLHPLLALLRPHSGNLILDMHNIESELAAQLRAARGRLLSRVLDRNPERIRRAEVTAAALVDRIWVCSRSDRQRLHAVVGETRSSIVPNGVPRYGMFAKPLPPPSRDGKPVVLFVGHLGYEPNVRAVERLCRRIGPRLRARLPESRLLVAGRHPKKTIRRMAADGGFELFANPADITPYLARAHVVAVPVDIGGGTRLKILEAMAAGIPVVASTFAIEGLEIVDGMHAVLADGDDAFAAAVERLWQDPKLSSGLRQAARRFVLDRYGPDAIARAVHGGLGYGGSRDAPA